MLCPGCRSENPAGARLCERCGEALPRRCAQCAAENAPAARFCTSCGAPLSEAGAAGAAGAVLAERKLVTVLFADIQDSLSIIRGRDPEQASDLLSRILELMRKAVNRYDGTVNRIAGDGIMALFGAPTAHEDHALRGCWAALAMRDSVLAL